MRVKALFKFIYKGKQIYQYEILEIEDFYWVEKGFCVIIGGNSFDLRFS